jgi:serine/threonine protein kinase
MSSESKLELLLSLVRRLAKRPINEEALVAAEALLDNSDADAEIQREVNCLIESKNDYVSLLKKECETKTSISMKADSYSRRPTVSSAVAKGGYGSLYRGHLTADASEQWKPEVIIKHVKSSDRERGSDMLNELTIMFDLAASSRFLMPGLACKIEQRTSEIRIAMPVGIGDMAKILRRSRIKSRSTATFKRWVYEIVGGIAELHENGIVHADVKPGNMVLFPVTMQPLVSSLIQDALCAPEDSLVVRAANVALSLTTVRLSDFGISVFAKRPESGTLERGHRQSYTPLYRPPEVWRDEQWSYESDIWALGCSLYEILFGRTLFPDQRGVASVAVADGKNEISLSMAVRLSNISMQEDFAKSYDLFKESPFTPEKDFLDEPFKFLKCSFRVSEWGGIPGDLRLLIASMLRISALDRITIFDAKEHPFIEPFSSESGEGVHPMLNFGLLCDSDNKFLEGLPRATRGSLAASREAAAPSWEFVSASGSSGFERRTILNSEVDAALTPVKTKMCDDDFEILKQMTIWILSRHLPFQIKNRSTRLRRMQIHPHILMCACIATKVLRQTSLTNLLMENLPTSAVSPKSSTLPSLAKDERAICEDLSFRLFPFREFSDSRNPNFLI